MLKESQIAAVVDEIPKRFRTFGGGRTSDWNPIASALADSALQFAAGVDVRDVVAFVLASRDTSVETKLREQLYRTAKKLATWGKNYDITHASAVQSANMLDEAKTIQEMLAQLDLLAKVG